MDRFFALCAGILALAMLAPAAGSQQTPTPEDPMAKALTTVSAPASAKAFELLDARQYLVDQRQVARPMVVKLLASTDVLVRMNAAIVLTNMAKAGDTSAATLQALQTAMKDMDLAVAFWGFQGLMSDGVPGADQAAAIREMMKMERPRALRLAALSTIGERKPKSAAPIIVSHLQEVLKEYAAQVETVVTTAETIPSATPAPGTRPAGRAPGPAYAPPRPLPTGPPESPMSPTLRRRMQAPSEVPPLAPGTPPPHETYQPETSAAQIERVRRADLPNFTLDQLQTLAQAMEDDAHFPIVAEVHQMGLVLEDIVTSVSPDAPLFDFKTTPPWDLNKCVDKAVIYMNSHRADYGAAPAAPKPAAPTPAVAPGAAPTTRTAPATTAATPAGTTPGP